METHIIDQIPPDVVVERNAVGGCKEDQSWVDATQHLQGVKQRADQVIRAYPAACLGAALAVGVTLGWWVKR